MSKIRVYELAKELGLDNKALLDLCMQLDIDGKRSHSNSLSDDEAERIRRYVIRSAVSERDGLVREVTREGQLLTERRVGGVIRRRKKTTEPIEEEEDENAPSGTISLDDVVPSKELPTLAPDLQAEKKERDAALERADALFQETDKVPEEGSVAESEIPADRLDEEESPELVSEEDGISEDDSDLLVEEAASETEEAEYLEPDESAAEAVLAEKVSEQVSPEETTDGTQDADAAQGEEFEGETTEEAGTEEDEDASSAERLADVRKRHDIRAPKVLGRIELPAKPEPPKKSSTASTAAKSSEAEFDETGESVSRGAKGRKRKPAGDGDGGMSESGRGGARRRPKKKQILRKDELLDYEDEREVWKTKRDKKSRRGKSDDRTQDGGAEGALAKQTKKLIKIDGEVSVGELAKQMGLKAGEVIAQLMKLGVMATINQLIDFETATVAAEEFGHKTQNTESDVEKALAWSDEEDDPSLRVFRPPVVTVMGHVDHGKTSLLDAIRKTSVTAREVGGITQHIGAYNVKLEAGGSVTFLDTPGHEAFTAMRSRGAQVTDIVVLVVAADDGVMPQTIEAINHAKAAEVPIIVAINKMDKEDAYPDRVINQLSEYGLVPEDWGGDTLVAKVSAQTGEGVEELLESLHLQAEILELKANPDCRAMGTIVESKLDKGRGPVLTVLVQKGTLRKGDAFVAGSVFGKIRALVADDGTSVEEAGPSIPVEAIGASATAASGDDFVVLESEVQGRKVAEDRAQRQRRKELASANSAGVVGSPLTLERFSELVTESAELKELPLIVKADVQGSVEAVCESFQQLSNEEVKIRIIHKGVGAITENDVQLASASRAVLVAYNVRPDVRANPLIENEGLELLYSRVIYDLVDSVKSAVKGRMAPKFQEKTLGRVEVRQTFRVPKQGVVAGSYVLDGNIFRGSLVRLLRDGIVMYEGKMSSLRRFKEDVKEVAAGYECGIALEGYTDIKDGDVLEVYKVEEVPA